MSTTKRTQNALELTGFFFPCVALPWPIHRHNKATLDKDKLALATNQPDCMCSPSLLALPGNVTRTILTNVRGVIRKAACEKRDREQANNEEVFARLRAAFVQNPDVLRTLENILADKTPGPSTQNGPANSDDAGAADSEDGSVAGESQD